MVRKKIWFTFYSREWIQSNNWAWTLDNRHISTLCALTMCSFKTKLFRTRLLQHLLTLNDGMCFIFWSSDQCNIQQFHYGARQHNLIEGKVSPWPYTHLYFPCSIAKLSASFIPLSQSFCKRLTAAALVRQTKDHVAVKTRVRHPSLGRANGPGNPTGWSSGRRLCHFWGR